MADVQTRTPERATITRRTITAAQKQQLIDNLQNEVASRARKLRAQYALHARSLRDRLEMRINRIPHSLRKTTMEDLISRYSESLDGPTKTRTLPSSNAVLAAMKKSPAKPAPATQLKTQTTKNLKRTSNEMSVDHDKENAPESNLDLPKKRLKTTANNNTITSKPTTAADIPTTQKPTAGGRVISRKVNPSQILSPKSHNSRTLPHSPIRAAPPSPIRSLLARPVSPIKSLNDRPIPSVEIAAPASTLPNNTTTTTSKIKTKAPSATNNRAASKQQTTTSSLRGRPPTAAGATKTTRTRAGSNTSNASGTSAGTTIVKKAPAAAVKKGVAARVAAGLAGAGSKRAASALTTTTTTTKKGAGEAKVAATAAAANPSGRTLRSRK